MEGGGGGRGGKRKPKPRPDFVSQDEVDPVAQQQLKMQKRRIPQPSAEGGGR